MKKFLSFLIAFLSFFAGLLPSYADEGLTILKRAQLEFNPSSATLIVLPSAGQALRLNAMVFAGPRPGTWFIGAKLPVTSVQPGNLYAFLVEGEGQKYFTVPPFALGAEERALGMLDVDSMRDRLADEREKISSWQQKALEQAQSLARARQDAELIGNFAKVLEISDEIERTKIAITRAEEDAQSLQELVRAVSVSASVQPRNFVNRELQLTKQLVELADASKRAESDEVQRRAGAETTLQENLAMIEATRGDDPEVLRKELAGLKQERELLEKTAHPQ